MENLECPHCGSPLGKGVALCGECGKEVADREGLSPTTYARMLIIRGLRTQTS